MGNKINKRRKKSKKISGAAAISAVKAELEAEVAYEMGNEIKKRKKKPQKLRGTALVELEVEVSNASLFSRAKNTKKPPKRNTRGLPDDVLPILQPRPSIPLTPLAQKYLDSFEVFPEAPEFMHYTGFNSDKRSKLMQIERVISKSKPAQDSAIQVQFNDHLANLSVMETLKDLEETVQKKREVFKKLCFKNSLLKAKLEEKKTVVIWPAIFKECEDLKDQLVDTPMPDIPDDVEDDYPNDQNEIDIENEGESNETGLNDSELIEPQFHVVVREVSDDGPNAENGDVEPEVEDPRSQQPFEVILDDLENDERVEEDVFEQGVVEQGVVQQFVVQQDAVEQHFAEQEFIGPEFVGQEFFGQEFVGQEFVGQVSVGQEFVGQEFVEQEVVGQGVVGQEFVQQNVNVVQGFVEREVVGQEFVVQEVVGQEFVEQEVVGQEFVEQEVAGQQVIEEGGFAKYEEIVVGEVEPQSPNESDKDLTAL